MSDKVQLDRLQLEIEEGLYPPRFQIAAGGDATESVLAEITFKGTAENLNTELLLKPETLGIILSLLLKSLSIIYQLIGSFINPLFLFTATVASPHVDSADLKVPSAKHR